jgi:hypothetical protein
VVSPEGLLKAAHICINVPVEELQEEAEVNRVSFVRRASQKQEMVCPLREELPEPIALCLMFGIAGAHPMGFVDNDKIPRSAFEAIQYFLPLGPVY